MRALRVLCFGLICATTASAQIVNVQPLLAKDTQQGFLATLEGSDDWRKGNTELFLLTGNALVGYRGDPHFVFAYAHAEYGIKSGVVFLNKDVEHLRYRISLKAPLQWEAFLQHDRDAFRLLALRGLLGTGPRVELLATAKVQTAVAGALMLEYERLQPGAMPDPEITRLHTRLSFYATASYLPLAHLRFGQTFYYQPRPDDWSNVRILSETEVRVEVTHHIALRLAFDFIRDSHPAFGVRPQDLVQQTAVQVTY